MGLDINTPNGQEYLKHEQRAIELFHARFHEFEFRITDKRGPAKPDGLIYRRNEGLLSVAEVKCREATLELFRTKWNSEWLITDQKLIDCRAAAALFDARVTGLLYLIPDDVLLVQRIFNSDGTEATRIRRERTETQATCNGGTANRMNAFVLVTDQASTEIVTVDSVKPFGDPECERARTMSRAEWVAEYEAEEARLLGHR